VACSGRLISGCGVFVAACSISFGDTVVVLLSFAAAESLRLLLDQGFEDSSNADVTSLANISSVVLLRFFIPSCRWLIWMARVACGGRLISGYVVVMVDSNINFSDIVVPLLRFAVAEILRLLWKRGLENLSNVVVTSMVNTSSVTLLHFLYSFIPVVGLDGQGGV
jgi:hypothetical protein